MVSIQNLLTAPDQRHSLPDLESEMSNMIPQSRLLEHLASSQLKFYPSFFSLSLGAQPNASHDCQCLAGVTYDHTRICEIACRRNHRCAVVTANNRAVVSCSGPIKMQQPLFSLSSRSSSTRCTSLLVGSCDAPQIELNSVRSQSGVEKSLQFRSLLLFSLMRKC